MGFDAIEPEQRRQLRKALAQAGIGIPELWMRYFSVGGEAGEYEVDAYLSGSLSLPPLQRDILAHAANELIDDLPPRLRAPYSDDIGRDRAESNRSDGGAAGPHDSSDDSSGPPRRNAGED